MANVVDQDMYNYGEILNTPGPNPDKLFKEYTGLAPAPTATT